MTDIELTTDSRALVSQWLHECVVGLSLCPYASAPLAAGASAAAEFFFHQASLLVQSPAIETTLIIFNHRYQSFFDFNDWYLQMEDTLAEDPLCGELQLAGFHPDYLFGGEEADDQSHFTNRAPFPIIQLLRITSVSKVVDSGDTLKIPERNCRRLRALQKSELRARFPWSAHWV